MKKHISQLWGSAFESSPSASVLAFTTGKDTTATPAYDYQLLPYDIWVNQVHVQMLAKQKLISQPSAQILLQALEEIEALSKVGKFVIDPSHEDVHTAIETWIIDQCGLEVGGLLHTARSRNDQVATDTRLYLRDATFNFAQESLMLAETLIAIAKKHQKTICPGYTHHQPAMVTTFGHILLGFAAMITRDCQRFLAWNDLHNHCPLGSTTAYGTSLPIDREFVAKLLAFDQPTTNSLDPIMNRWEAESDLVFNISVMMNHLSSLAETVMLFSMPEFGFLTLADEFSTGSSIMPQKKNPDPLEIIKGKASYASGILQSLLGTGKANFIGYNRDTQWTKYQVMDVVAECLPAPQVMSGLLQTMTVNQNKMAEQCHLHYIGATNFVELLVNIKKLPFRLAKILVEKAIKISVDKQVVKLAALNTAILESGVNVKITPSEIDQGQDPHYIVSHSTVDGGPGWESQQQAQKKLTKKLAQLKKSAKPFKPRK